MRAASIQHRTFVDIFAMLSVFFQFEAGPTSTVERSNRVHTVMMAASVIDYAFVDVILAFGAGESWSTFADVFRSVTKWNARASIVAQVCGTVRSLASFHTGQMYPSWTAVGNRMSPCSIYFLVRVKVDRLRFPN